MIEEKTRAVPVRETKTHPAGEVLRRLLLVATLCGVVLGAITLVHGWRAHRPGPATVGGVLVAAGAGLLLFRQHWGGDRLAREIAANPFKPARAPQPSPTPNAHADARPARNV